MIENGVFQRKKQGKIEGSFVGERVKETLAATKGSRPWGWSMKGLTDTQTADNGGRSSCARASRRGVENRFRKSADKQTVSD